MLKRIIFIAIFLNLFIFKPAHPAIPSNIQAYAQKVIEIEAKEKEALASMMRSVYSVYQNRKIYVASEEEARGFAQQVQAAYNNAFLKLRELRNQLSYATAPFGSNDIQIKFLNAKDLYLQYLKTEVDRLSKMTKLTGQSDTFFVVSASTYTDQLRFLTNSFKNYKAAWDALTKKLPQDFKYPPLEILNYEFKIIEVDLRHSITNTDYNYGNIAIPPSCSGIHAEFLKAKQIYDQAKKPNLCDAELGRLVKLLQITYFQGMSKLADLISSSYLKTAYVSETMTYKGAKGPPPEVKPPELKATIIYGDSLLNHPTIKKAFEDAWRDSQAQDPNNRHEEGGWILKDGRGGYKIVRWPKGLRDGIFHVPMLWGWWNIVGSFHTHPNPDVDEQGQGWNPGPSRSDIRCTKAEKVPGYVISWDNIYKINPDGSTQNMGPKKL